MVRVRNWISKGSLQSQGACDVTVEIRKHGRGRGKTTTREKRRERKRRKKRAHKLIKLKLPTLVSNFSTDQDVGTNYLRSVPDSAQAATVMTARYRVL
jgi:hypothetical protein